MNNQLLEPNEAKLSALLHAARPAPDLPPGFHSAVWRRIERAQAAVETPPAGWFEWLLGSLLRPRWALAGLTAALLLGGVFGVAQGVNRSNQAAQERYLAAVSPLAAPH